MSSHDVILLVVTACSILLLIFLIVSKLRFHPLIALLVVSIAVGLASGFDIGKLAKAIESGAGGTLGGVGLTVALGAMLGRMMADSGASDRIASVIVGGASRRSLPWLMSAAAFVIGIPMFFEVGLIILLPLIFTVAKRLELEGKGGGSPYVLVGVPVIAALASMHGMVPPHPGPLVAIAALKADLGRTMVYGFICAIPAIILAGPVYGAFIAPRMKVRPDDQLLAQYTAGAREGSKAAVSGPVSTPVAFVTALLPVLVMLARTLAETLLPKSSLVYRITQFIGDPVIAMLIGVLAALLLLGYLRGVDAERMRKSLGESLKAIAGILLIIAGGGAFAKVLVESHVGDAIVHLSSNFSLSAIALGWVIAALLSVSTGSATVGIVGASALLAPLIAADSHINASLLVVAIGSGSLFFNYANHAGFWLVKESFGMTMGETFKTITIIQSIVGLVGLAVALLLNFAVG